MYKANVGEMPLLFFSGNQGYLIFAGMCCS